MSRNDLRPARRLLDCAVFAVAMGTAVKIAPAQVLFTTQQDWGGNSTEGWAGWGVRSSLYQASGTRSADNGDVLIFTGPDLDGSTINGIGNYDNDNDPPPGGHGGTGNGTSPIQPDYAGIVANGTVNYGGEKSPGGSMTIEDFQGPSDSITAGEMLYGGTTTGNTAFVNALTQNGADRGVLKISYMLGTGAQATNYLANNYFVVGFFLQSNNGQVGDGYYGYDLQTSPVSASLGNGDTGDSNAEPGSYTVNNGTYFTSYIPYNLTGKNFLGTSGFQFLQMGLVVGASGGYVGNNITLDDMEVLPKTTNAAEWNVLGGASWGAESSWDDGTVTPVGVTGALANAGGGAGHVVDIPGAEAGDEAAFDGGTPGASTNPVINVACTVTLDGNRTIGALDFSNSNSYTLAPGTGGTLVLANVGTLAANITNRGENGTGSNGSSIGTHYISAPVQITANGAVINQFSTSDGVVISGNISGPGSLTTEGGGTVTLSGSNTYGGGTFNYAGNLLVKAATGIPSGGALTNNGTVTVTAGANAAPVLLGDVSGTGTLNVGATGSPAYVRLASGSGPDTQGAVNIASGSTLDITNNRLVIQYGSPAADPIASIKAAINSGAAYSGTVDLWTGTGITTSAPPTFSQGGFETIITIGYLDGDSRFDSQYGTVAANTVLVKYAVAGDAFLQNSVGFEDLLEVAQHYQMTGMDFAQGNFFYATNGSVGFADLLAAAQLYGQSFNISGESNGGSTIPLGLTSPSAVPEPASMTLLAAGAMGIFSRRRRKT